jgi:cytochrome bd-type quinol oxidase subunit 2
MLTTTLCVVLSAAGLALAAKTAYRRRYLRATRIAALALVPVGLAMAGLVTLGRKIVTAFGDWAADLVFKPQVWTGFAVLACAAALYAVTALIARRGRGRGGRTEPDGGSAPAAVAPAGPVTAPALTAGRSAGRASGGRRGGDSGLSGFEDIEEILKRRGI